MTADVTAASRSEAATGLIEHVVWRDQLLAIVCRATYKPAATEFLTPPTFKQQLGFIVYPGGGVIQAHSHKQLERSIVGTSEVLLVRSGRMEADFYNDERQKVATKTLETGDVLLLISGGHGFRMLEDTVLLEVKQGPYTGIDEKERF